MQHLGKEWKMGVLGVKIEARQAKLEGKIPPMINQVNHDIKLSHNVTIQPRKALKSKGVVWLPVLSKWLNVTTEPMQNIGNFPEVHTIESYTTVKPGTKRVAVALHAYSLPRIEESLDCLNGACIFTSLDLKSEYWQVEMDEKNIPYTAFTVGPLGFYKCICMPFGLTNTPATFQRLMESCLGELHLQYCIIYLDDIIIFSKTPKGHLHQLRLVFQKISEAGLKLKPSKCEFFKNQVRIFGAYCV